MILTISDIDGVLADFTGGACNLHGYPTHKVNEYDWYKNDWNMTSTDFWGPIEAQGHCFYQTYVNPYPWLKDYLRMVTSFGPLAFCTVNPLHPGLSASKTKWIRDHIGDDNSIFTLYVPRGGKYGKELLASSDTVLIDDADENVEKFEAAGGNAILFPQPWNKSRESVGDRLGYVKHHLKHITRELTHNV